MQPSREPRAVFEQVSWEFLEAVAEVLPAFDLEPIPTVPGWVPCRRLSSLSAVGAQSFLAREVASGTPGRSLRIELPVRAGEVPELGVSGAPWVAKILHRLGLVLFRAAARLVQPQLL